MIIQTVAQVWDLDPTEVRLVSLAGYQRAAGRSLRDPIVVFGADTPRHTLATSGRDAATAMRYNLALMNRRSRISRRLLGSGMAALHVPLWSAGLLSRWAFEVPGTWTTAEADSRLLHRALGRAAGIPSGGAFYLRWRPTDAHYKPTFQLFDPTGRIAAFAKVGWNSATAPFVQREAQAFDELARVRVPGLTFPALAASGRFGDRPFLITRALSDELSPVGNELPAQSILEGLSLVGRRSIPGSQVPELLLWRRLGSGGTPRGDLLGRAAAYLVRCWGDGVAVGLGHGDFVPWNLARDTRGLVAWDWEHFDPAAPVGSDALHWLVLTLRESGSWESAFENAVARARVPAPQSRRPTAHQLGIFTAARLLRRSAQLLAHGGADPFPIDQVLESLLAQGSDGSAGDQILA